MWRDRVYNGTLRPKPDNAITGLHLDELLNSLHISRHRTHHATRMSEAHDVNCITQGLYLGDRYTAKDKRFLVRNGFTHVLNAAEGSDEFQVNTNQYYYRDARIGYMGMPGHDRASWNISLYLEPAAKFIDEAVRGGGKVLVHCVAGISRSATLVLAYLMIYKRMNVAEALAYTFKRRKVYPNPGFLNHLAHLDASLKNRRRISSL